MNGKEENKTPTPHITVSGLTMAYGDFVIQRDLSFAINRHDVFIIMGGSG
ncbi:MAG: polyamine ABC transporter ATP-binding protein, partial [Deltaproteobacteria bacterium]|nr:polyamine ABC transporter ATP-binding protein [Deltaproteobacteria bacterium]